ncbi:MAG: aminoacyl-tRNA hydrolase [Candidatus Competibacteraceae bacterium]|uniref:Peptidyl-tRNA hydrolase n=1 Tax=Candidatus Contendobacter odensis Run_B_J11 TaxID=1400861 RepID=A0A7U7GE41_9GAMM|nr:aminoacyl-tRNA hydrolase [Candidatus Contendobacter odensis]MBK8535830.1 aminoacyl-tRNA hydrolase [Candidatus Competibacteraceae bacterium]MBK8750290.1 aminoacyl-tRNA hydrolase [Candidatus Competibacteraceae bacterium]CDH46647.1 peptidyl-tRNA hydrolase [Candidatus Contendobacter odensis Run_B_J11]
MSAPVSSLRLIVGLGNPGPQYAQTRHNAGFWLADELARQQGGTFRPDGKVHGDLCRIIVAGQVLWLLKPMTFMNRSGLAVATLARFHRIPLPEILIVHDDLDLPPGAVRLKRAGGHGGHNGLRDLMTQLGGNDFFRLRLGIGHPGDSRAVLDYVLGRAPQSEQGLIEQAITDALRELPHIIAGQWDQAMQTLHRRRVATDNPTSDSPATS